MKLLRQITYICTKCGKQFRVKITDALRGRGKYCSKACMRDE